MNKIDLPMYAIICYTEANGYWYWLAHGDDEKLERIRQLQDANIQVEDVLGYEKALRLDERAREECDKLNAVRAGGLEKKFT